MSLGNYTFISADHSQREANLLDTHPIIEIENIYF